MDLQGLVAISDTTSPIELMELRLILEPAITRLAAFARNTRGDRLSSALREEDL